MDFKPEWVKKIRAKSQRCLAQAVLGFFGFVNVYFLLMNIRVAVVCTVNQTALRNPSSHCGLIEAQSYNKSNIEDLSDGEFVWNQSNQGLVLGSFLGLFDDRELTRYKDRLKRVYGYSMFSATVATFTPVAVRTSFIFLIVLRLINGIVSGCVIRPCMPCGGCGDHPLRGVNFLDFNMLV